MLMSSDGQSRAGGEKRTESRIETMGEILAVRNAELDRQEQVGDIARERERQASRRSNG